MKKPPKDREKAITQAREILADFFDAGICVMSWEEEGHTFEMHFSIGNHYACETLARRAEEIVFPTEEDEDEEEAEA
jgi:hypothetical protein